MITHWLYSKVLQRPAFNNALPPTKLGVSDSTPNAMMDQVDVFIILREWENRGLYIERLR